MLLVLSVFVFSACQKKQNIDSTKVIPESKKEISVENSESPYTGKIDLDLSKMNYNMISSITFEMLIETEKYAGKTVKISGNYHSAEYEGNQYYSVVVWDATRCCPAGISFYPVDSLKEEIESLEQDAEITLTGKMVYSLSQEEGPSLILEARTLE